MLYTSAEANKLLKKLNNEEQFILSEEKQSMFFNAAVGEDIASVKPDYSFANTNFKLAEVQRKIRKVKHAINTFNLNTTVDGITIDEALILLPQLRNRLHTLERMASSQRKVRVKSYGSGTSALLDYQYANFDIEAAKNEFDATEERLANLQLALDKVNSTVQFEIDI